MTTESPNLKYYGYTFQLEIYDNKHIDTKEINIVDKWSHLNSEIGKILSSICHNLCKKECNVNYLLESVLSKLSGIIGCECASIISITSLAKTSQTDRSRNDVYSTTPFALYEMTPGVIDLESYIFPRNYRKNNLLFQTFDHNIAIISNDITTDPRTDPDSDYRIRNYMGIPLRYKNKICGVLSFSNKYTDKKKVEQCDFIEDDILSIFPVLDIISRLVRRAYKRKRKVSLTETIGKSSGDDTKDKFLAVISHEIRTPLNGILGMVTLLPDSGPLNSKQQKYVKNLTECTYHLTTLLNNILDFTKIRSGKLSLHNTTFDLNQTINTAIKIFESKAIHKGLEFKVVMIENPPQLIGDAQRISQILVNLVSNSLKFTKKGYISVGYTLKRDTSSVFGRWIVNFTIKDTGVGIPLEDQDKIFEIFYQSKTLGNTSTGSGLGLSISKELVKMMGGKIKIHSEGIEGRGTTVNFTLKLDEEISLSNIDTDISQKLKSLKVLIVDDRSEIRLYMSEMLWKWGCIPHTLPSAEEAIQYISYGGKPDLALIDIVMPGMSGIELAQTLRSEYNVSFPLVGLSSSDSKNGSEQFDYYTFKPVDQMQLFSILLKFIDGTPRNKVSIPKKDKKKMKILIAEDDHRNSFTLKELLLSLGYSKNRISIVVNGKKCVEKAMIKKYDIILMDVVMPVMDGIEASLKIKRMKNPPIIIAISAAVQDREKCVENGIDFYLPKPVGRDDLEKLLNRI